MSVEQSPIKLQLEESIWLDHRAQQVEIVSLELVPQLDLFEEADHINIKGNLVLMGRFDLVDEEESLNLESSSLAEQLQFDPLHVQQKELYQEEFRGKIEHPFPFEVSIPSKRVKDLDQLFVSIDQFDYLVTDGHRLSIKADIAISGIESSSTEMEAESQEIEFEDQVLPEEEQVEEQAEVVEDLRAEQREEQLPTLEVEAIRDELYREKEGERERATEQVQASSSEEQQSVNTNAEEEIERPDNPEVKEAEVQELEQASNEPLQAQEKEVDSEEDQNERPELLSNTPQEIKMNFKPLPTEDGLIDGDTTIDNQELGEKEKLSATTSYLTQLMEHGNEERQFARLKMCIIQADETLESIAERYSISVQEIIRMNRLESERTSKGQIIYIPHA